MVVGGIDADGIGFFFLGTEFHQQARLWAIPCCPGLGTGGSRNYIVVSAHKSSQRGADSASIGGNEGEWKMCGLEEWVKRRQYHHTPGP